MFWWRVVLSVTSICTRITVRISSYFCYFSYDTYMLKQHITLFSLQHIKLSPLFNVYTVIIYLSIHIQSLFKLYIQSIYIIKLVSRHDQLFIKYTLNSNILLLPFNYSWQPGNEKQFFIVKNLNIPILTLKLCSVLGFSFEQLA